MSEESDNFELSEDEVDDKTHNKLIENVLQLNKVQHVKSPHRTEPTTQVSEFNLVKSLNASTNLVHINELTKVLKGKKSQLQISNKVKSTSNRSKTLLKPLEKPQADLIKRTLNYEKSKLELDRWEALVTSNRAAAQLKFPLGSSESVKILQKKAEVYPSSFRIKSDLQKKLEAIEPKVEEFHINTEEKDTYPLTLGELKEKRKETAKLRAHQSFKEAKARRQNKIKSKKYHRILRREKIKQKLKEFEELQKINPEEALKKLEDIEKARAEERFSLRHKGTGQWARNKQIRAKYDKESRQELAKQLAISRDLTQKLKSTNSESEDEENESSNVSASSNKIDENNPWIHGIKPKKDVTDFVSGYRKYWNEKNQVNSSHDETTVEESNVVSSKNIDNRRVTEIHKDASKNNEENETKNSSPIKKVKTKIPAVKNNKQKRKLKDTTVKSEVNKLNEKKKIKKVTKKRKQEENIVSETSVSTSEWEVSSFENKHKKNTDIEDVFDSLEEKISKQTNQKLKKIKNKTNVTNYKTKPNSKTSPKKRIDLSLPLQKKKQVIDEEMLEQAEDLDVNNANEQNIAADPDFVALKNIINSTRKAEGPVNINPDTFIKVKQTNLNTAIPDILTTDENEESVDQRDIIMEAFEDDNIAEDFDKEKTAEIEKDKPQDVDLNLPGWGSWAGVGIDPSKRKRKRFIIKMPQKMPRKDDNKGSLIINEQAQAKIKSLLVSELPFPFKTVKDYEASIRAPIGNTFVSEMAFRRHIQPSVITKMGTIIEPINKSILMGVKQKI